MSVRGRGHDWRLAAGPTVNINNITALSLELSIFSSSSHRSLPAQQPPPPPLSPPLSPPPPWTVSNQGRWWRHGNASSSTSSLWSLVYTLWNLSGSFHHSYRDWLPSIPPSTFALFSSLDSLDPSSSSYFLSFRAWFSPRFSLPSFDTCTG